jgi:hypothetical protein
MKVQKGVNVTLRVDRIVKWYDPWEMLELKKPTLSKLLRRKRQIRHQPHYDRYGPTNYDLARILHFYLCFTRRTKVEPVYLDATCSMHSGQYFLYLSDGHHRLCGADIAHKKTIQVVYRGTPSALDYLRGITDDVPNLERNEL